MRSLGGKKVRRGRQGGRERVKRWAVAGERKGERAQSRWTKDAGPGSRGGVSGSRARGEVSGERG